MFHFQTQTNHWQILSSSPLRAFELVTQNFTVMYWWPGSLRKSVLICKICHVPCENTPTVANCKMVSQWACSISEILTIGSSDPLHANSAHQLSLIPGHGNMKMLLLSSHSDLYGGVRSTIYEPCLPSGEFWSSSGDETNTFGTLREFFKSQCLLQHLCLNIQ